MVFLMSVLGFLFVFSLIVSVHELGHFLAAKRSGVKVNEFAFGFPPKLWSKKYGETKYAINMIPIGGYVKLYGEDGSNEKDSKSYSSKSAGQKIFILLSGVTLNFVLAYIIILGSYIYGIQPLIPGMESHEGVENTLKAVVVGTEEGSPAEEQGLKEGDVVKEIDGKSISGSNDVIFHIQEKVNENKGEDVLVNTSIERDGEIVEKEISTYGITVEPSSTRKALSKIFPSFGEEIKIHLIGVQVATEGKISAPLFKAITISFKEVIRITQLTLMGITDFFQKLFFSQEVSEDVAGPVGIVKITSTITQMGMVPLLQFTAILSIAIGIFNVLPIPGLDGGHALIILIESIFRKKFSNKVKNMIQFAGFGALIILMVIVSINDVLRWI